MTDKVQKIREEVERLQNELIQEKENGFGSDADDACILELQNILTYIDSLQEEPVNEDFEKIVEEIAEPAILNAYGTKELARRLRNTICSTSVSEDLSDYINELSKQFPKVSFAKLSRIAVRVAKWQKEQMMAKAIDARCFGFQGAALFSFRLPAGNYLVGSEVKVIVIKKD